MAADVWGSGAEQGALLPMLEASMTFANDQTVIRADAADHRDANLNALKDYVPCELRAQCLAKSERTQVRQVALFPTGQPTRMETTEIMRQAIASPQGRAI